MMNCVIVLIILYILFFCEASWIYRYVHYIKMFIVLLLL